MKTFEPVTGRTRAGRYGKLIACPCMGKAVRVYHFAWSALQCPYCGDMVEKADWVVVGR